MSDSEPKSRGLGRNNRFGTYFSSPISFETLMFTGIAQILSIPSLLSENADATRIHSIARESVLWLDDYAHSVLKAHQNLPDYEKERNEIVEKWKKAKDPKEETECAHRLFALTMYVFASRRLFKVRTYSYLKLGYYDNNGKETPSETDIQKAEDAFSMD